MRTTCRMIIALTLVITAIGCAPQPPKCSDERTTSLLLDILSEQLAKITKSPKDAIRKELALNLPVAVSVDEKVRRLNCQAMLKVTGGFQVNLSFTSMVNDQDRHVVILNELANEQALPLVVAVNAALASNEAGKVPPSSAAQPAALASNAASGLESLIGTHPGDAIQNPELKSKLQLILKSDFEKLADRIVVASMIERHGPYLVGSGCMPHACSIDEASYAVNIETGATFAVVLTNDSLTVYGGAAATLPEPLQNWYRERGGK